MFILPFNFVPFKKQIYKRRNYILIVVAVLIIISMGRTTIGLLGRGDVVKRAEEEVKILEKEQEELYRKLAEVESEEFIEKEAREKLGLAKVGEVVLVLPPEEVLRSLAPPIEEEEFFFETEPIWRRWLNLFFTSSLP